MQEGEIEWLERSVFADEVCQQDWILIINESKT
jgi:hypothetical protein